MAGALRATASEDRGENGSRSRDGELLEFNSPERVASREFERQIRRA